MRFWIVLFILMFLVQTIFGQDSTCSKTDTNLCYTQVPFPKNTEFGMEKIWESEEYISSFKNPILGDINTDCIPEIFINSRDNSLDLLILDGVTGKLINSLTLGLQEGNHTSYTIADLDKDGDIELIIDTETFFNPLNKKRRLVCYNLDNTEVWTSDVPFKKNTNPGNSLHSIVDFNQDGIPEVYIMNEIYNGLTGVKIADGGINGIGEIINSNSITIAGHLDDDLSDIELAAGYTIYKVDINNLSGITGNSMAPHNIMIDNQLIDGYTRLADINKDGVLDVIVMSRNLLYAYTMINGVPELIAQSSLSPFSYGSYMSNSFIGSIDGSAKPSIILFNKDSLLCFNYNGTLEFEKKWSIKLTTGFRIDVTIFDFDNNGINEIIYHDKDSLIILDGSVKPPKVVATIYCAESSRNNPIVADVNNDGQANICLPCGDKLTLFGSPDSLPPWAPARGIWNQFNYNPLFINDDLTVPQYMKNPATYKNGKYNNFFVQESLLDEDGMYLQKAANLTGQISCVNYDAATNEYTVQFELYNLSDASLDARDSLAICFYDRDPEVDGNLLGIYYTVDTIWSGTDLLGLTYSFSTTDLSRLYMVINTNKDINSPFEDEDYELLECDYTDNILQALTVPIVTSITDNICNGDSYDFHGTILDIAGSYFHTEVDGDGCDSLVVSLVLNISDTIQVHISNTTCDSYMWNDSLYDSSGRYVYQSISDNGCDSIVTLDLTIHTATNSMMTHTACDSFKWNEQLYIESGLYQFATTNILGCDSVASLDLKINPSSNIHIEHAACVNYTWNGQNYTQSGSYIYQSVSSMGCDSMVTLDLIISDKIEKLDSLAICQGDSIEIFGQWIGEEVELIESYISQTGCDSIQTIQIVVNPLSQGIISESICEGDSIFIYSRWFSEAGEYELIKNNVAACDSVLQISISERSLANSYDTIQLCQGDTLMVLGFEITDEQTVEQSYVGGNACDSTAHVMVSIQEISSTDIEVNLCPGDSIWLGGNWVTDEGIYHDYYIAFSGCDSVVNTSVRILEVPDEPTYDVDCEDLEIITSIDLLGQDWAISWSNGATVEQTSFTEGGMVSITLFYEPDCYETYELTLPEMPVLSEIPYFSDYMVHPDTSISLSLGLDGGTWQVHWSATSIIDCDDCMDVVLTPTENVEVFVVLSHISGCEFTRSFKIIVNEKGQVFDIPNIFDSNKESWIVSLPKHIDIIQEAAIYDRWGNQLASWSNTKEILWDGKFKGELVQPGVYIYYLKYLERGNNTSVIRNGDLTVIR